MEVTEHEEPTSALQRKSAKSHQDPDLGMPRSKKLKVLPGTSDRKNRATESRKQSISEHQHCEEIERGEGGGGGGGGEESERVEVEGRISALQRIVPGGEKLGVDKLFEETAEYILSLQCQVKAMRALTSFFEGLERSKRKLGG